MYLGYEIHREYIESEMEETSEIGYMYLKYMRVHLDTVYLEQITLNFDPMYFDIHISRRV